MRDSRDADRKNVMKTHIYTHARTKKNKDTLIKWSQMLYNHYL